LKILRARHANRLGRRRAIKRATPGGTKLLEVAGFLVIAAASAIPGSLPENTPAGSELSGQRAFCGVMKRQP
jgi:hypothetical protein